MTIRAVIFDMDGTLVDTNWAHVEAWRRAFARHEHDVPRVRIVPEIGKGGDQLLPAILGEEIEEREGDEIRETQGQCFRDFVDTVRFELFPGSLELMAELRDRGVRVALATSSERENLELIEKNAGCDLQGAADEIVTKSDARHSKPAPDLVSSAVKQLHVSPRECLMLGDTPHDGEACRRAGVPFAAVLCGGSGREELAAAGAVHIWRYPEDVLRDLDSLLADEERTPARRRASPGEADARA